MLNIGSVNFKDILSCVYSKRLLNKLNQINADLDDKSKINIQEVEKGIIYAKYYHGDQKRDSGEPYYSHPFEVAYMVSDYLLRTDIIITAILHDTLEDTSLIREEIAEVFGEKVAEQVYDLTRIKADGVKISSAQMLEELWLQKKKDILLLKLCDRLHNMQTISAKSPEKAQKIADETIKNFTILSEFLELPNISYVIGSIYTTLGKGVFQEKEKDFSFSFIDDYQPLSLIYQSTQFRRHTLQ